jgi:hypothetical protein
MHLLDHRAYPPPFTINLPDQLAGKLLVLLEAPIQVFLASEAREGHFSSFLDW